MCKLIVYVMVKIKKSTKELNAYLSRVYVSREYPASFSRLDKLYRIAKKDFPSITRNEIKQWADNNLSIHYTNHLGGILSVTRYMHQKSIVYGKPI